MPEHSFITALPQRLHALTATERFRLLAAPVVAFIAALIVVPLIFIAVWSLWTMGASGLEPALSFAAYERLFSTGRIEPLLFTLRTAALVTLADLIVAYPVAYFIYRHVSQDNKQLFLFALVIPFVVSRILRIFSLVFVLSQRGFVSQLLFFMDTRFLLYSEVSMYIGLILDSLPLAIFPIWLALERIDKSLFEASADLGASGYDTFKTIVLPLSVPGLAASALLVFVIVLGAEAIPSILGGPSVQTIANVLMEVFSSLDLPLAGAISVLLLGIVLLVLSLFQRAVGFSRIFEGI